MPELAEVEYFRRKWDAGMGGRIERVALNGAARVFRGINPVEVERSLTGRRLVASKAHGKQMLFQFSAGAWLGVHLGMTGELRVEGGDFVQARHDHLVLFQVKRALVFTDPRQFGRVKFHCGESSPLWWEELPPSLVSDRFTVAAMSAFLERHRNLPVKAALLLQDGFPGIGNWMADEILWRAKFDPRRKCGGLNDAQRKHLWRWIRFVCRGAMKHVSGNFDDPPRGWLFNERWGGDGICPIHRTLLERETVGGRTTAWCARCQR